MFRRRNDGTERRGTPAAWVFVGLGNPGIEYRDTRHNLGAVVVEELAARHDAGLKVDTKLRCRFAEQTIEGHRVLLAVPTTYMNESAASVVPLLRRSGLEDLTHLVIVHDELDFEAGRLQLKTGGGLAGHNGLRSIAGALGTETFSRLRIGIGKPASKEGGADWVLARPSRADRETLDDAMLRATDALEDVVKRGLDDAAARLNGTGRG